MPPDPEAEVRRLVDELRRAISTAADDHGDDPKRWPRGVRAKAANAVEQAARRLHRRMQRLAYEELRDEYLTTAVDAVTRRRGGDVRAAETLVEAARGLEDAKSLLSEPVIIETLQKQNARLLGELELLKERMARLERQ